MTVAALLLLAGSSFDAAAGARGSGGRGVAFYVLAAALILALAISLWRLRRRSSGPET